MTQILFFGTCHLPDHPGGQRHWNELILSMQVPEFKQGLKKHSSMLILQFFPKIPEKYCMRNKFFIKKVLHLYMI